MRSVAAVKSTTPSTPAQGGCRSLTHAHALSGPTPRRVLLADKGFRETNLTFSLPLRRTSAPACEINRPRA
jgi:hypothetical protein